MRLLEAFRVALSMIWAQKMKSGFSLIGVFVGVTFLIAVVTIMKGMNTYMEDSFAGQLLGVNTFRLRRFPDFTAAVIKRKCVVGGVQMSTTSHSAISRSLDSKMIAARESEIRRRAASRSRSKTPRSSKRGSRRQA